MPKNQKVPQLNDVSNDIFAHAIPNAEIVGTSYMMNGISRTCKYASEPRKYGKIQLTLFKQTLDFRKIQTELLQAVVDNKEITVRAILFEANKNKILPELLLLDPQYHIAIESKLTWQKFYAENPLTMAAKRKQPKMIELLLSYYDILEQTKVVTDAIAKSLSAWKPYEFKKDPGTGKDEIAIPPEYTSYAKSLIEVFAKEAFPYGITTEHGKPTYKKLSDETELFLTALLDILIPKKAVKLDDYLDVELFLLAFYQAFSDHFNLFKNDDQKVAFCVRANALIKSVLHAETSEICCDGIYYASEALDKGEQIKICETAHQHKLKAGESFYRADRNSRVGLGFDFDISSSGHWSCGRAGMERLVGRFGKIMSSKNNKFLENYAAITVTSTCRL